MTELPKDPMMLLSVVNMKMRDEYESLDALCEDLGCDRQALCEQLATIGYEYNEEQKRFW